MRPHHNLDVWRKSIDFVAEIYKLTAIFPETEKFGLTSQLRRAVVSIPVNIAEGVGRESQKEFRNFISIAQGSAAEIETQLIISNKLGYINAEQLDRVQCSLNAISKMLTGLRNSLSKKNS